MCIYVCTCVCVVCACVCVWLHVCQGMLIKVRRVYAGVERQWGKGRNKTCSCARRFWWVETSLKGSLNSHMTCCWLILKCWSWISVDLLAFQVLCLARLGHSFTNVSLDGGVWFPGPFLLTNLWASSTLLVFLSWKWYLGLNGCNFSFL